MIDSKFYEQFFSNMKPDRVPDIISEKIDKGGGYKIVTSTWFKDKKGGFIKDTQFVRLPSNSKEINYLTERLEKCLSEENYELAIKLRDKIKVLTQKD